MTGLLLSLIAAVAVLAGCAAGSAKRAPDPLPDHYRSTLTAVCAATSAARAGDLPAARQAFYDTAHQALHQLAADAARTDRPVAARLLEAKEVVESAFSSPTAPAELASHLNALSGPTADAITTATGTRPPPCAPRS